jgi:RNA polymerase-binding transcription factor DksA
VVAERLSAARAAALARVEALRRELADVIDSASSTTGDDEHDPEGATIGFERAQAQALLDQAVAGLGELDAARQRLADGAYGVCVDCGRPIGVDRLTARPAAARCIACESRNARSPRR